MRFLIKIEAEDNIIRIESISDMRCDEITALFNSSADMRYATGVAFNVAMEDTADVLERAKRTGNEFISGIYLSGMYPGIETDQCKTIGIISGKIAGKTVWIRQLAIHPSYRRKRLGTRSAGLILQKAREIYSSELACLSVVENNIAGFAFWRKLGFTQVKSINKELFGDKRPYNIAIMQKKL